MAAARESIIAAVVTRLGSVGSGAPYLTLETPFVTRTVQQASSPPFYPAAYLSSKGESYERVGSHGAGGVYAVVFQFQIAFWTRNWTTDAEASKIITDVLYAMRDWTLGSTCDDSFCEATQTFTSEDDPTLGGVVFNWAARFRINDQSPQTRV